MQSMISLIFVGNFLLAVMKVDCFNNQGVIMSHVNIWMVVIAWGVSILLAYVIGSRKGKPGAGALVGLLLGPIGVIVSLLFA